MQLGWVKEEFSSFKIGIALQSSKKHSILDCAVPAEREGGQLQYQQRSCSLGASCRYDSGKQTVWHYIQTDEQI